MARYQCPQCGSAAAAEDGHLPVCLNCGFGSNYAQAANQPAPSKPLGGGAITSIVVGIFLLVGGAIAAGIFLDEDAPGTPGAPDAPTPPDDSQADTMLSQAEADARAAGAVEQLDTMFASGDPGDLRMMVMNVTGSDPDFGDMDMDVQMEWGLGDKRHVEINMAFGGQGASFTFNLEAYCGPDQAILVYGADIYEARTADPEECQTDFDGDADYSTGIIDPSDAGDLSFTQATPNPDGSVSVTYIDVDGVEYAATIDAQGRLTMMTLQDEDLTGTITLDYGPKRAIEFPAPTARLPADVTAFPDFGDHPEDAPGSQRYELLTTQTGLARNEFEVRLYTLDDYADDFAIEGDTPVTTFNLNEGASSEKGFSFSWMSADVTNTLDDGEVFRISHAQENVEADYYVVLWDLEVDQQTGTSPLPGPGLLLIPALIGVAWLRRR